MRDLISRQAAIKEAYSVSIDGEVFDVVQVETLMGLPSAQPEITDDDVKEYCSKRCYVVVTSELYHEMIKRWSQIVEEGKPWSI